MDDKRAAELVQSSPAELLQNFQKLLPWKNPTLLFHNQKKTENWFIFLEPLNKMQEVLTISFWRLPDMAFSFIASMSSKYLACMFGECCFKYEFTISAGIFPDRKSSIVWDGQLSRTSIENSRTSMGSVSHNGCIKNPLDQKLRIRNVIELKVMSLLASLNPYKTEIEHFSS